MKESSSHRSRATSPPANRQNEQDDSRHMHIHIGAPSYPRKAAHTSGTDDMRAKVLHEVEIGHCELRGQAPQNPRELVVDGLQAHTERATSTWVRTPWTPHARTRELERLFLYSSSSKVLWANTWLRRKYFSSSCDACAENRPPVCDTCGTLRARRRVLRCGANTRRTVLRAKQAYWRERNVAHCCGPVPLVRFRGCEYVT